MSFAFVLIQPVLAASTWSGHRPNSSYYDYTTNPSGPPVTQNNALTSDSSVSVSAQPYDYKQGGGPGGLDLYHIRVAGAANARVAHTYTIAPCCALDGYDDCSKTAQYCVDSQLQTGEGKWWSFGGIVVNFWGHSYTKIFVCSNGWAAFEYNDSAYPYGCPARPMSLPQPDYKDSSTGKIIQVPKGVIAPFWETLDPTGYNGGGKIMFDLRPPIVDDNRYPNGAGWGFGVTWIGVTVLRSEVCHPICVSVQNSFSFSLDDIGDVSFGYGHIDTKDPDYSDATMGVDDPTGYLAFSPDRASTLSYAGVNMVDPGADNLNALPYSSIQDTKIVLTDLTPSDGAQGGADQNFLYTYNLRTTTPPPVPDTAIQTYAPWVVGGIAGVACVLLTGPDPGCIEAVAVPKDITQVVLSSLKPATLATSPVYSSMTGGTSGGVEIYAHEEDQLCGGGRFDMRTDWHDCAKDVVAFDQFDWAVPSGPGSHTLQIQFGIQLGPDVCCSYSGYPWRWTSVTLTVDAGDFTVSSSGQSASTITPGSSLTSTINLSFNSLSTFPTTLFLCSQVSPNNLASTPQATFNPQSISLSANQAASSTMTVTTTSTTAPAAYNLNVVASDRSDCQGDLIHTTPVSFSVVLPDFTISANPASIGVYQGSPGTSIITVSSLNTFSGSVALSANSPAGFSATLNPTTVSISSGGTAASTLTVSLTGAPSAGAYTVTVAGSSGTLSHPVNVQVSYPGDFTISPSSPITYGMYPQAWWWANHAVSVSAVNGFTGTVSLTANPSAGLSTQLSPSALTLTSSTTSASSALGFYASSGGLYSLTVTGTSGSLSHSTATISVSCADFSLSTSPTSFSTSPGSAYSVQLTVGSVQGFSGTVQLSIALPDSTWGTSGFPTSLTVNSGLSTSATFTIWSGSTTAAGTYSVTITGSSSLSPSYTWSHTTNLSVTIMSSGGGGGGSVAAGTLITLANGTQVPVQNLRVGMQLLSYNMTTRQYTTITITRFVTVQTDNLMIIHTSTGKPLIVDQNPAQKLEVMFPDGTWTELSVTQLRVGDYLFDATTQIWVPVTSIQYENGGVHIMYDIYTNAPTLNYIANNYLDYVKV